jgi:hypothetical protein
MRHENANTEDDAYRYADSVYHQTRETSSEEKITIIIFEEDIRDEYQSIR